MENQCADTNADGLTERGQVTWALFLVDVALEGIEDALSLGQLEQAVKATANIRKALKLLNLELVKLPHHQ